MTLRMAMRQPPRFSLAAKHIRAWQSTRDRARTGDGSEIASAMSYQQHPPVDHALAPRPGATLDVTMDSRIRLFIPALALPLLSGCASLSHYDCGGGVATGTGARCLTVVATNVPAATLTGTRGGDDYQPNSILNATSNASTICQASTISCTGPLAPQPAYTVSRDPWPGPRAQRSMESLPRWSNGAGSPGPLLVGAPRVH